MIRLHTAGGRPFTTLLLLTCAGASAAADPLPRSSPEQQGVSSSDIAAFVKAADERIHDMNSFMLLRHGHVVAEGWWSPYEPETRHSLFSLTKSFTSTAVGLAISEGRLKLEDRVLPYFPEDASGEPGESLKAMRVRDLLTMSAGHHAEAALDASDPHWKRKFLAEPVAHKPGTFFLYNTPASYMLSAMVQKAAGMKVLEYLRPRLFEPLGIADPVWDSSPEGVSIGGYGLKIRTEDIARFGQLYLKKGEWRGKRLVPAAWIEAATARQMSNGSSPDSDWEQGYGFQFWRCRHNAYRADGAFGQFCIVMPDQDAVVAITSGVKDLQAVMNLVWERLLPAMRGSPLPPDDGALMKLKDRLSGLNLRPQQGSASSPMAARVRGRRYVFAKNEQGVDALSLDRQQDGVMLAGRISGVEQQIACGMGKWKRGRLTFGGFPEQSVAASGAWTADDTYVAILRFPETPFAATIHLRFEGDQLFYDSEFNVAFGPTKRPQLIGIAR